MSLKIDRLLVLGTAALVVLGAAVMVKLNRISTDPSVVVNEVKSYPTLGNLRAPVQLVMFEDLKCVWCARFSNDVLPKIKEKYIDTGKAKYTLVLLAFLPGSKPAANAALEVSHQNGPLFFRFVDAIYANQGKESEDWASVDRLKEIAAKIPGINLKQMTTSMQNRDYDKELEANFELAGEAMKGRVFGTPTLFVNGVYVDNLDYDSVCTMIEKALKESDD